MMTQLPPFMWLRTTKQWLSQKIFASNCSSCVYIAFMFLNHLPQYTLSLFNLSSVSTYSFALSYRQMLCTTTRPLILSARLSLPFCSNRDQIGIRGRPQAFFLNWETDAKFWYRPSLLTKPITKPILHSASLFCDLRPPSKMFWRSNKSLVKWLGFFQDPEQLSLVKKILLRPNYIIIT